MRVFISYCSKDRTAVQALVASLQEQGIDCWWDQWYIDAGTDIVAAINRGFDQANAGIIVFSDHSRESRWVEAETSYLTYARIQENKVLVPVIAHDGAWVPPLLRPLAHRSIQETTAIADAVRHRTAGPPPVRKPELGRVERVLISLYGGTDSVSVRVKFGREEYAATLLPSIPRGVLQAQAAFRGGFRLGARSPQAVERAVMERTLLELGRELGAFCLPGGAEEALSSLVAGCPVGTTIEVCFEANQPDLLALPFEALRFRDGRLLATVPSVVTIRRPAGIRAAHNGSLAGPLKILVAVGAPDEENTSAAVLDQERELQNILDAVEPAQRLENVEVRILEVGHPKLIGEAMQSDAYHVLHLSCHGLPGKLELEDEDGRAVRITADDLLDPIRETGRPLPMVFLNSCHGGVHEGQAASFAQNLLSAGFPCVPAMQTSVTDGYASQLALAFYRGLAQQGERLLPSRALANARRELELQRQAAAHQAGAKFETPPEYASAALFVTDEEHPLADFGRDKEPLRRKPVHHAGGPVPQLKVDDLIGRRKELRLLLRSLRGADGQVAGAVLTGLGGSGKSAVAGRAMQRLSEEGWLVAAHAGRFNLTEIAMAAGLALAQSGRGSRQVADLLLQPNLDDRLRFPLLCQILATEPLLLVLDDFEQNLTLGGDAFLDEDVAAYLAGLARSARVGRLLLTSRYPVPGAEAFLVRIPIGPLSPAETRKLTLRLPTLRDADAAELSKVLRAIGGHPRMLEFLDALLRGGQGRFTHVTEKLRSIAKELGLDLRGEGVAGSAPDRERFEEQVKTALLVGARDVFLAELVAIAQSEGVDEVLLQAACSNLPITPAGVARMLAGSGDDAGDPASAARALRRLESLSLVVRLQEEAWVHRWTAQGLAAVAGVGTQRERFRRAGRYRCWRAKYESRSLVDAVEGMRNFLAGEDFDSAAAVAKTCFEFLRRAAQSVQVAALASEVLETLPDWQGSYAVIADAEAQARLALGQSDRALKRYEELLRLGERLAAREPERAIHQRNLSVSYERMGNLYRDLGQGEQARQYYLHSLAIRERLAEAEPDRAVYQRDLWVSYNKMGDLHRKLGEGEQTRQVYLQALAIAERLVAAEPERADYQRDLSVSYNNIGDLYRDLGQGDQAREYYQKSLVVFERLVAAEPERADYQRDLSVAYERMGDRFHALGRGEQARQEYLRSLVIRERLVAAEPERADYQRNLSVSHNKLGDLYRDLVQGEQARQSYLQSLAIAERLAQAEPARADYQRDLSVSYERLGDLYRDLGQSEQAREYYLLSLAIFERLARVEPERADHQRGVCISLSRLGMLEQSPARLRRALEVLESLQQTGRMLPGDEPFLAQLREVFQGLGS